MASLLHIFAQPHAEASHSMRIAQAFLDSYRVAHPDDIIVNLDLYHAGVPHLSPAHLQALSHQGDPASMSPDVSRAWQEILGKVHEFTAADKYVVTTPMWNFGVPSILKAYIDHIVLAGYTFKYTGPGTTVGLLSGRPMAIISSRGGIYSQPPLQEFEMCVRYLHNVFGFLGIDVKAELVVEGLALVGAHEQAVLLDEVLARAREAARTF